MITKYNEFNEPSFELTRAETQELELTGYCVTEEGNYCIAKVEDNQYAMFKLFDEYTTIKFNYGDK